MQCSKCNGEGWVLAPNPEDRAYIRCVCAKPKETVWVVMVYNGEYNSTHVAGIFKTEKDAWEFYEVYENPYYGITGIQQHEVF